MAYLVKPFEMGDIAAMVKISLAGAPRLKEKIRQAACLAPASTPRDALLVLAADGSLESASPAALQLLAWSSGDGTAASPLHTRLRLSAYEQPGDPAEAESVLRSLLQTAQSGSAPCWRGWYHPASGSPIPLLIAAKPAADRRELQLRKIPAAALRLGKNAGVAPGAAKSPAPSGALAEADSEDALTGLPNRDAILSRLDHLESTGLSLFVLFPEHTSVLRQRFGSGAIDRIFLSYTQHLAQHLPAECQLARWDAISFVVLPKPEAGLEMEREISRVLSSPMLYHLQLAGRSALLRVTCAYSICKPGAGGPLADQIETLVADHGRR
jgi:GGDEF domain-containing protein